MPLTVVYIPSETPSWKTNFSFAKLFQLEIASCLGTGSHIYFHLEALEYYLTQTFAGPVHDTLVSMSSYVSQSCYVWKALFLWNHISLWLYNLYDFYLF